MTPSRPVLGRLHRDCDESNAAEPPSEMCAYGVVQTGQAQPKRWLTRQSPIYKEMKPFDSNLLTILISLMFLLDGRYGATLKGEREGPRWTPSATNCGSEIIIYSSPEGPSEVGTVHFAHALTFGWNRLDT